MIRDALFKSFDEILDTIELLEAYTEGMTYQEFKDHEQYLYGVIPYNVEVIADRLQLIKVLDPAKYSRYFTEQEPQENFIRYLDRVSDFLLVEKLGKAIQKELAAMVSFAMYHFLMNRMDGFKLKMRYLRCELERTGITSDRKPSPETDQERHFGNY